MTVNGTANGVGFKCPGCDRHFQNEWGMRVHARRAHGTMVGKGGVVKDSPPAAEPKKKAKGRDYSAEHARRVASRKAATAASGCRYCPNCGTNLALVNQALAAVEGLSRD